MPLVPFSEKLLRQRSMDMMSSCKQPPLLAKAFAFNCLRSWTSVVSPLAEVSYNEEGYGNSDTEPVTIVVSPLLALMVAAFLVRKDA